MSSRNRPIFLAITTLSDTRAHIEFVGDQARVLIICRRYRLTRASHASPHAGTCPAYHAIRCLVRTAFSSDRPALRLSPAGYAGPRFIVVEGTGDRGCASVAQGAINSDPPTINLAVYLMTNLIKCLGERARSAHLVTSNALPAGNYSIVSKDAPPITFVAIPPAPNGRPPGRR